MKKTLKEEMLEAIENRQDLRPFKKSVLSEAYFDQAASSCVSIADKHIKIARLEGMIEVYKYVIYNRPQPYDIRPQYKALKQQLKELKGIKTCPRCKLEFTKEELLTNEHCFNCGKEMSGF